MSNKNQFNVSVVDLLLLILLAMIWSTSFILIKIGVGSIPPLTITFIRMIIGACVLFVVMVAWGERLPRTRKEWIITLLIGVLGNALPFTLIQWGEQTIDSGLAALFMGFMPIWVAILAYFFTNEGITARRVLGILIALSGLVILFGWSVIEQLGQQLLAQLAVIFAAICYAICSILIKHWQPLDMRPIATGSLFIGALIFLPCALLIERPSIGTFSLASIGAIIILGAIHTALASLIYFYLIARIGATLSSQVNCIVPILGVLWGALLLGEQPGSREFIAVFLTFIGLILVNKQISDGQRIKRKKI